MRRLSIFLLISATLTGCFREFGDFDRLKDIELNPTLEAPLVDSRVTFSDFDSEIPDFTVGSRADGTVTLYFQKQLYTAAAVDYYEFLPQNSQKATMTGFSTTSNGSASGNLSAVLSVVTSNSERFETVELNSGTLRIQIFSDFPAGTTVSLQISIPSVVINGVPFSSEFTPVFGQNTFDIDLTDAVLFLSNGQQGYNQLPFNLSINVQANGVPVAPINKAEIEIQVLQPNFHFLYGSASARNYDTKAGTEDVDVLGNIQVEEFAMEESSFTVELESSFGIPVYVDLKSLEILDRNNLNAAFTGSLLTEENPFLIQGLDPLNPDPQGKVVSTFTANASNSNVNELISRIPKQLVYDVSADYPGGDGKFFVYDNSTVTVTAKAEIPLYGRIKGLVFEKEKEFSGSIFEELSSAELLVTTRNRYPIAIGTVLTFLDANDIPLLTLFQQDPIITSAPPVDAGGRSTEETIKEVSVALTDADLEKLATAAKVRMTITLNTSSLGAVPVRFMESDYIDVHLGIKAQVSKTIGL